jgi:hypothetical protein
MRGVLMIDLWDVSAVIAAVVVVGALVVRHFYTGRNCGTACGSGCGKKSNGNCG